MPQPIPSPPPGLRQRPRKDDWRIWWEPSATQRAAGAVPVELDDTRLTWSVREARALYAKAHALVAARPTTPGRTVADLINRHTAGSNFQRLRPDTKVSYRKLFARISRRWNDSQTAAMTKPMVHQWAEDLTDEHGAAMASALIRAMSVLMTTAELIGWRPENSNPCFNMGLGASDPRDRVATWAEIDALTARALEIDRPSLATAIMLGVLTGQRESDILSADRAEFRRGHWRLIRSKRKNAGAILLHDELRPWIAAQLWRTRQMNAPEMIINEATGQPYKADTFQRSFRRLRDACATDLPEIHTLVFRDLRRTFATFARDAGADAFAIGNALGNTVGRSDRLTRTYIPRRDERVAAVVQAVTR